MKTVRIILYDDQKHREQVVLLWEQIFGYEAAHNEPGLVIDKKIRFNDDLFFVAIEQGKLIGTVMAGYDGHRGWIYSVAVSSNHQKQGLGSFLLRYVEKKLSELGCMKINLQIMECNETVEMFYRSNGYSTEKRISMGKMISKNIDDTKD